MRLYDNVNSTQLREGMFLVWKDDLENGEIGDYWLMEPGDNPLEACKTRWLWVRRNDTWIKLRGGRGI